MTDMHHVMDAVSKGDLSQRVPGNGSNAAFDMQAQAFNRMLDCISEQVDEIRNVTNGVAHELRTPLARLRNRLNLLAHDPKAAAVRGSIEEAQAEADRLLHLFSALLRIAEVDSGARRQDFRPVNLTGLTEECVDALDAAIEESGHRISRHFPGGVAMLGDGPLLSQMIVNLLENAMRHTPAGTRIAIGLAQENPGWARLTVADDGPGIPPADRARALDRFGRVSGVSNSRGHGFGLTLVASIVRLHGGTLELGDADPGLEVTILFPTM